MYHVYLILNLILSTPFVEEGQLTSAVTEDHQTFKVYFSPLSSPEKIKAVQFQLNELGFDISFTEITFDNNGYLNSFKTDMTLLCNTELYEHTSITAVNQAMTLGVVFIGTECQNGAYATSIGKDDLHDFFFGDITPDHELFTWDGYFEALKELKY